MKIKIPKGPPQKSRGAWERKPLTKVKESAKTYKREAAQREAAKGEKKEWEMGDFVESVDEVMQKQEKENPDIKHLHARLSPEWKIVSEKISQFLSATDEAQISSLREEIIAHGDIATRVLLDFLMSIKMKAKG